MMLKAVCYNQLTYFLVSNLWCGAVNVSVRTLHQDKLTSILLMGAYLMGPAWAFSMLRHYKISLNF